MNSVKSFVRFFTVLVLCLTTTQNFAFGDIPFLTSLLSDPSLVYKDGKPWSPTDFSGQNEVLGNEKNVFAPPANMKESVQFWISVYTDYTSQQGLLHDIDNLDVVYEKVDFEFINKNSTLTERQKSKAREKYIDERKKRIEVSLNKILTHPSIEELTDFDQHVMKLWSNKGGESAMREAASIERIRFQLGQSDRMKEAIYLSGRYFPMMERVFKEEGLPLELTRLVFVESSFNVLARSKVGASGLWQIMPSAARGHLKINKTVDLRNHPEKATELAAKMLKFNYQMLGAWPLAITGYNHGPYGVKRLVEKNKTKDIGELIATGEGRRFGFASRNFYASFLAVLEVEGRAAVYFPGIKQAAEFKTEVLKLEKPIYFKDLVELFDGDVEKAQLYNPHLQRAAYLNKVTLENKNYLVVPSDIKAASTVVANAAQGLEKLEDTQVSKEPTKPKVSKSRSRKAQRQVANSEISQGDEDKASIDTKKYKVTRGDTLYRISRQFGVSIRSILSANDMKRSRIKAGQVLILPD